jgi:DNA-binding beta-propeller fold protein YncE
MRDEMNVARWGPRRWWLGVVLAVVCLAGAAPAQAQPFVYVANGGSNGVSQFDALGGPLVPLTPATAAAGGDPTGVAVSPDGKSVYVTNFVDNTVSQYDVGAGGALTPKTPATVATGMGPLGVAVSADGASVYVANINDNTVSQYDVGPGGALTPKNPAAVASGNAPFGVAVSPDGKSVYVTNRAVPCCPMVSQYDVGAGGSLTPKTPATVATAGFPTGVAVSPDSKSVYVTNTLATPHVLGNTVSQYDVGVGGALTPKTPDAAVAGSAPRGVAVSPDGTSVYVTNSADNTLSQYDVGAGGALTPKAPATVATGSLPVGVALSPDGKSVYVTNEGSNSNTVSQYDVGAGGTLTPKTPATVAAGTFPDGIAVTPLPRVHPTATGVSCSPSVFAPGGATVCRVTVTDTAGAGQSTPTGTVSFTNTGAGRFFGSPCTLSGSGGSASCAVFFSSFPRGGQGITASYSGDSGHSPNAGTTMVLVAVPASTEGCVVFGHGRIAAAAGDQASFRGLAAATPPRGAEFYRDNGPANPMRVRSSSVEAVTCSADATRANVFGNATINRAGSVEYRIDVQLAADKGGKDSYRIRLSNGYDSGAQPIRHGDVDIRLRNSEHGHHDANAQQDQAGDHQDGG